MCEVQGIEAMRVKREIIFLKQVSLSVAGCWVRDKHARSEGGKVKYTVGLEIKPICKGSIHSKNSRRYACLDIIFAKRRLSDIEARIA